MHTYIFKRCLDQLHKRSTSYVIGKEIWFPDEYSRRRIGAKSVCPNKFIAFVNTFRDFYKSAILWTILYSMNISSINLLN